MTPVEFTEEHGEVDDPDRGYRAQPQCAAQSAADLAHRVRGLPCGVESGVGARQQGSTGIGEQHALGGAFQQRRAEFSLEVLDRGGDRGLDDVQPCGGTGEVRFLGDGDEVLELAQFHPPSIPQRAPEVSLSEMAAFSDFRWTVPVASGDSVRSSTDTGG